MTPEQRRQQQYSDIRWEKRWNNTPSLEAGVAAYSQVGNRIMMVCTLGVIYFDLEDLPYVTSRLKAAVDMLEGIQKDVSAAEVPRTIKRGPDLRRRGYPRPRS